MSWHRYVNRHVPDSKVHGANMGPIWGRQDPGGPDVGPMNLAIWGVLLVYSANCLSPLLLSRCCPQGDWLLLGHQGPRGHPAPPRYKVRGECWYSPLHPGPLCKEGIELCRCVPCDRHKVISNYHFGLYSKHIKILHWSLNQLPPFCRRNFQKHFPERIVLYFESRFPKICSYNGQKASIGSGNCLALNRRQVFTGNNVDPVNSCKYAPNMRNQASMS